MRLRPFLLASLAAAATIAAAPVKPLMSWVDLVGRVRPRPDATIAYGEDETQRIDVWVPSGPGPFPVVLMVHGGCWTSRVARRNVMDWAAADLRTRGIAVWNIDYRGVDRPGGGYPGTFADTARAADLLAIHAAEYRLDPTRVVAVGHSAGGHLALWLAARPKLPAHSPLRSADPLAVSRVVSLGGLPDLEATANAHDNGCGTEVVARLVGTAGPARRDVYADTSIPRLLPLGIDQTLVNGEDDRIVPRRLATGYLARAKAAGDRATLRLVPDSGHVELIAPDSAAWAEARRRIEAGLAQPSVERRSALALTESLLIK